MDVERLKRIRRLIIVALFADDELAQLLVLKGGNAIDLIHDVAQRASIDLDFSLESEFPDCDTDRLRDHFEALLNDALAPEQLAVLDVKFTARPPELSDDLAGFWGGYELEFKIVHKVSLLTRGTDLRKIRMSAEITGPGNKRVFRVDFSQHEFCAPKREHNLDGYAIYVYSPEMIVSEKLRAICQQMPKFRQIVRSPAASPRPKDFF